MLALPEISHSQRIAASHSAACHQITYPVSKRYFMRHLLPFRGVSGEMADRNSVKAAEEGIGLTNGDSLIRLQSAYRDNGLCSAPTVSNH